ncbi:MAG: transposase [Candidatus Binatia bacterium]
MARRPRIEFSGALYHVIVRGNQRQEIFHDEADYRKYLSLLCAYKGRYQCKLFAYTLMSNHVHLIIETGETPLSKVLQGLNQSYTQYYNLRWRTVGHLFQGRYKAILCDRDKYLLALVRYIHLNPVRGGIVEEASKYPWSSHRAYLGMGDGSGVNVDEVLKMFSSSKGLARRRYLEFVREGIGDGRGGEYYRTVDQRILGTEEFAGEVQRKGEKPVTLPTKVPSLATLAHAVSEASGVRVSDLRGPGATRTQACARRLFVLSAREVGYRNRAVAGYLGRDETMTSKWVRERGKEVMREVSKLLEEVK